MKKYITIINFFWKQFSTNNKKRERGDIGPLSHPLIWLETKLVIPSTHLQCLKGPTGDQNKPLLRVPAAILLWELIYQNENKKRGAPASLMEMSSKSITRGLDVICGCLTWSKPCRYRTMPFIRTMKSRAPSFHWSNQSDDFEENAAHFIDDATA